MTQDWHSELAAAKEAAAAASALILQQYARLDAKSSAPADITTQTDRDSQDAILSVLASRFPNDAFRAEEQTERLASLKSMGERMWIIDPIDGTRGFVTKNGEFSVMIALVQAGAPVVGVVSEPAKSVETWATAGGGCWQWINGTSRRISTTVQTDLAKSILIQSHAKQGKELTYFRPAHLLETYSAGVKLARVADGTADLYVCDYLTMNDWDLAAGHILVTEAGGKVTNLAGEPRVYGRESPKQLGGLLATNGRLHNDAVQAIGTPTN